MQTPRLIMVLGDQLSTDNPALTRARPGIDRIVMAEVHEETTYVPHNRHKIVLVLAAMRHFAASLRERGFDVCYYRLQQGLPGLLEGAERALRESGAESLLVCEPGEYRLRSAMDAWQARLGVPVTVLEDDRFLASHDDFRTWAASQKQLRMEFFYRRMRKRYGLLLDSDGKPCGGRWNFDRENRSGWRGKVPVPVRDMPEPDAITREVIEEVAKLFPDNPGDLDRFNYAVTDAGARQQLDWFCREALAGFGRWQDAMADGSPWLFHSAISMYLNIGLLEPLSVCRRIEQAWQDGDCDLAAAEGFIRQILGWREYVRGVYWLYMPDYAESNSFAARRPLPAWFWNAETDLHCLQRSLSQSLDLGYGHHIQRLMIIGNFALLAGLSVKEVCDWYLAVYVDAFEWVELPNTLGMALAADDGLLASKPYAASGKYIQRQGDYCRHCRYDPGQVTGEQACPFNALYWAFLDRHQERLANNPRMALVLGNWQRKPAQEQAAIVQWADACLEKLAPRAGGG